MKLTTATLRQIIKEELELLENEFEKQQRRDRLNQRRKSGEKGFQGSAGKDQFFHQYKNVGQGDQPDSSAAGDARYNAYLAQIQDERAAEEAEKQEKENRDTAAKNRQKTYQDYLKKGAKLLDSLSKAKPEQKAKLAQAYMERYKPYFKVDKTNIFNFFNDNFGGEEASEFFKTNKNQVLFTNISEMAKEAGLDISIPGLNAPEVTKKKPGFFSRFFKEE